MSENRKTGDGNKFPELKVKSSDVVRPEKPTDIPPTVTKKEANPYIFDA